MPMYNDAMIMYVNEYSDNYSKTCGVLFQYCGEVPAVDNIGAVTDFTDANVTDSLNLKAKLTGQTGGNGTKNFEIMVLLKYLSNFWSNLLSK